MGSVRRVLDAVYAAAAGLAALSLLLIFLVMMAQMGLRALGLQLPAADDVSAYLCVSTTFFALAATFKRGELIRVGMALDRLGPGARRVAETRGAGARRRDGRLHRLLDRAGHAVLLGDRGDVAGHGGHPDLGPEARDADRRRAAAGGGARRVRRACCAAGARPMCVAAEARAAAGDFSAEV